MGIKWTQTERYRDRAQNGPDEDPQGRNIWKSRLSIDTLCPTPLKRRKCPPLC